MGMDLWLCQGMKSDSPEQSLAAPQGSLGLGRGWLIWEQGTGAGGSGVHGLMSPGVTAHLMDTAPTRVSLGAKKGFVFSQGFFF